jgi:hypothetical protein
MYLNPTLASHTWYEYDICIHDDVLTCSHLHVDQDDAERVASPYEDVAEHIHVEPVQRRTTLPPAYELTEPDNANVTDALKGQDKSSQQE